MTAHAQLGASGSGRWMNCPGSVALCADLPDRSGAAANEGTCAHYLAEMTLQDMLMSSKGFIGDDLKTPEGDKFTVTAAMAKAVDVYVTHVMKYAVRGDAEISIEDRFILDQIGPDMFGTNDASVYVPNDGELHVFDYKHGVGVPVWIEGNTQLLYYGLGCWHSNPEMNIERVYIHVVQPRCEQNPDIQTLELTLWDMLEFQGQLIEAGAACREPDAPLKPGKWCDQYFCKARATCPALQADAFAAATGKFSAVAIDTLEPTPPGEIPADELAQRLDRIPALKTWIKATEAHAVDTAKAGRKIKGRKLVWTNPRQTFGDTEPSRVASQFNNVTIDDLAPRKLKTPLQIKKIVGADAATRVDEFVVKGTKQLDLVSENDKREAVDPTRAFKAVDVDG